MTDELDPALRALAAAPSAVVAVAEVPRLLKADAEAAAVVLAALLDAGLVELWDHPEGAALVVSSLGAMRIGVELETPDSGCAARWVPAGGKRAERPPRYGLGQLRAANATDAFGRAGESGYGFDSLADPNAEDPASAGLAATAFDTEPAAERAFHVARRTLGTPYPRILLGLRLAWPVAWDRGEGECPGCGGRKLGLVEACLVCDRTGVDNALPAVEPYERPAPYDPEAGGLCGGTGRPKPAGSKVAKRKRAKRPAKAKAKKGKAVAGRVPERNSFDLSKLRDKAG